MKALLTGRAEAALFCLLLSSTELAAQGSMLRINCEGDSAGAEVTANGQFKGECPLDMQVQAGSLTLRVIEKVDASRVRVFEQEMRMSDGIVKRVDVVLGAPELTPEGRQIEAERIRLEQVAAQARDEERRKAAAEALVLMDKHVDQLLLERRAPHGVETPDCPDCPSLMPAPPGRRVRIDLPNFSDSEIESWTRAIERDLAAYLDNPQESFRLPAQAQAVPCEGAEANVRRVAGLLNLADETPQKREEYFAALKPLGEGVINYYFRDVRMWPVQMACQNGKLDGPVDVWMYSLHVLDYPQSLTVYPRLDHVRFPAVNGEPVGAVYHVAKTSGSVTEYKDAAIEKRMSENRVPDFSEMVSFKYNYAISSGNVRSISVQAWRCPNSKYQDVARGAQSFVIVPLGAGRAEHLLYQGSKLSFRTLQ